MTIPELEPGQLEELRRVSLYKNRHSDEMAPIDADATAEIERLIEKSVNDEHSHEAYQKAAGFISRLVGWRSKDLDEESGQILLAHFDTSNKEDAFVDSYGRAFLTGSDNVASSEIVNETHVVQLFEFHQFRRNGVVREVTIRRKDSLDRADQQVEYCLTYQDLGRYSEESEKELTLARLILESVTSPTKLAGVAVEKTIGAKDRALRIGQQTLNVLLPSRESSTEDS